MIGVGFDGCDCCQQCYLPIQSLHRSLREQPLQSLSDSFPINGAASRCSTAWVELSSDSETEEADCAAVGDVAIQY